MNCYKMSDRSDTSSTVSIGSDNTEKSDEITTDTVIERPTDPSAPYHFNKAAHSHNRMTEIAVGGFHEKDMSEEYFMSVNHHKKSLR